MTPRYRGLTYETHEQLLRTLQGNILSSCGREHYAFLVCDIDARQSSADFCRWVRQLPITTAWHDMHSSGAGKFDLFCGFYLSASGYKRLGIRRFDIPRDVLFRNGMRASRLRLNDPSVDNWEHSYAGNFHALIIVAATYIAELQQAVDSLTADAGNGFRIRVEYGSVLRNEVGGPIEPFGFADGISQPLFLKNDIDKYVNRYGMQHWDPSADPFSLVLAKDHAKSGGYGSYLVFRRLEQDVEGFNAAIAALAQSTGMSIREIETLIVGRDRAGARAGADGVDNDFNFGDDPGGAATPFYSHIRKMNQRSGDATSLARRIVRRGVPFVRKGSQSSGLFFLAFQQDIARQFEHLQRLWAEDVDFPFPSAGNDILIAQSRRISYRARLPNGLKQFTFPSLVKMTGGEYLFAPSVPFIRELQ